MFMISMKRVALLGIMSVLVLDRHQIIQRGKD